VFIGSVNHSVYAFRASDGKRLWRFVTGGIILSSPAVVGGTVYIGSADHNVYALRARDGAKRWARRTGGPVYAIPSVVGRSLYVTSQDSKLYALDASTGAVRWTAMYNDYPISSVTLDGRSPAVADGRVFTTGFDTSVRAFSASNGHKVWRLDLWRIDLFQSLADPAVANGVVYFGASEDRLLAFKASSGKLLFSGRTAQLGLAYFSAAVTDGKVIMGSNDGKLHVFHLPSGAGRHQPTYSTSHNPKHHRGLTG
jgi:outer membrane protein assembly factor BamB